jgi:hypothetical protein
MIADSFRTIPNFAPKPTAVATMRHQINEGMKRVIASMNGSAEIIGRLHDELDAIFLGTTRDT